MTSNAKSTVCVFAYGSNMCVERMQARVPGATPLARGYVARRRFVYHKQSVDGSAKADASFTGLQDDHIWGVAYHLPEDDISILDEYESFGIGYDREEVEVVVETGKIRAWIYIARNEAVNPSLLPYCWYRDFVIRGARQHRLPDSYFEFLHQLQFIDDPDLARRELNRRMIEAEPY